MQLNSVTFSYGQGCGYIEPVPDNIERAIRRVPVTLAGATIQPGEQTTLQNHFCRPLQYLGMKDTNEMVFFIGQDADLFEGRYYYQSVFKIQEDRIFEMFSPKAGRDFYFVKGEWK